MKNKIYLLKESGQEEGAEFLLQALRKPYESGFEIQERSEILEEVKDLEDFESEDPDFISLKELRENSLQNKEKKKIRLERALKDVFKEC